MSAGITTELEHITSRPKPPPQVKQPTAPEVPPLFEPATSPAQPKLSGAPAPSTSGDDCSPAGLEDSSFLRLADTTVPEGGVSGWLVILGCGIMTFWFNGISQTWGIFQAVLFQQGLASTSTLTFVGSLSITSVVILALFSGRLMRFFGARKTAMIGTVVLGLSEILSGFCTDTVGGLFAANGILLGLGGSLCFMVSSVVPAQHFRARLGLANGVVKACGGIGGTVLSFVLDTLIGKLGPAWTFRIIGFMVLATAVPAAWLVEERVTPRSTPFVDWRLFRSLPFTAVFLTGAVGIFALFVPPFFILSFAYSIGLSSSTGAGLLAGFNLCTAVGRIGSGILSDKIGPLNILFLTWTLNGISMLAIWPFSDSLVLLIIFVALNGMSNGAFFTMMPTAVSSLVDADHNAVATGMAVTGWSGGYLTGAPIYGFLLQTYGGERRGAIGLYRPAIFYAGGVTMLASGIVLIARIKLARKVLKKV
ncbi:hypothetical protein MMC13_005408 [Lambiella insularis]|nr:hypothetical protein [Lambiella insularis]